MAENLDLRNYAVMCEIESLAATGQSYIVAPMAGTVIEVSSVLNGAITTADVTLTPKIGGTALTNGALTLTATGSAAGDIDTSYPTSNNYVGENQAIEIECNGATSAAVKAFVTCTIRR